MRSESKRLDEQLNSLQSKLKDYPPGKIFCTHNGNRYKWYHSNGSNPVYIPKRNRQFAEQLAAKKYLSLLYEDIVHEKRAIDYYLRHHAFPKAEHMLAEMPEYQELLSPYFKPQSQELHDWMKSPYDYNRKYPEMRIIKTSSGNLVRSKSEALIDMALYKNKIPFRYECALQLGESTTYPDFTIRHPRTGKTYYWEHFGKMDDPRYSKNVGLKLQLYINNKILPGIQLITTYETIEHPLNSEAIENIIKEHFL